MEEDKKSVVESRPVEQEIDLIEFDLIVWVERKLILKVCFIAVFVSLLVSFRFPIDFSTFVTFSL